MFLAVGDGDSVNMCREVFLLTVHIYKKLHNTNKLVQRFSLTYRHLCLNKLLVCLNGSVGKMIEM